MALLDHQISKREVAARLLSRLPNFSHILFILSRNDTPGVSFRDRVWWILLSGLTGGRGDGGDGKVRGGILSFGFSFWMDILQNNFFCYIKFFRKSWILWDHGVPFFYLVVFHRIFISRAFCLIFFVFVLMKLINEMEWIVAQANLVMWRYYTADNQAVKLAPGAHGLVDNGSINADDVHSVSQTLQLCLYLYIR